MEIDMTTGTLLDDADHDHDDDDDSYSSSFDDTGSDDSDEIDEFGISRHCLANEMKKGVRRLHVEHIDPVTQKLHSFLNSGVLPRETMFYILLKNAVSYVDWVLKEKKITVFNFSGTMKSYSFWKA